jgi:hypothetical protein
VVWYGNAPAKAGAWLVLLLIGLALPIALTFDF